MNKHGFVKKLEADYALVNVNRSTGCGGNCSCNEGSCNMNYLEVKVRNTLLAKEGDLVELAMEPVRVTESIFLVYTLPMVLFLLGIVSSKTLLSTLGMTWSQGAGVGVGIVTMVLSYLLLKLYMTYTGASQRLELKMKRIV